MAQDFSSQYLDSLRFPNLPGLHLRLRSQGLLRALRWAGRELLPKAAIGGLDSPAAEALLAGELEAQGEHLRSRGWAFCDPILKPDFHQQVVEGWPKRCYFTPASTLEKSWDRGFDWRRDRPAEPEYLERHPAVRRLFDELRSEAFARRFSALVGDDVSCYSLVATWTVPGSVVAPHRDDWAFLRSAPSAAYNIVLFIDGTGGPRSGGLAILGSNSFEDVIFESRILANTALVYDTKAPFFHGFEPVERGRFRWAIIANFISRDFAR